MNDLQFPFQNNKLAFKLSTVPKRQAIIAAILEATLAKTPSGALDVHFGIIPRAGSGTLLLEDLRARTRLCQDIRLVNSPKGSIAPLAQQIAGT